MSELEQYKIQLHDIEEALEHDGENESLLELKKELKELIALLSQEADTQKHTEEQKLLIDEIQDKEPYNEVTGSDGFQVGDTVYIKVKLTKSYESAKITNISGNHKSITVKFIEDDRVGTYPSEEIHTNKPKAVVNKYKKKTNADKPDKFGEKITKSVSSWQNFNNKAKKKAVNKNSQFKTSDSVSSRVGVVNSGKPMTTNKKKERTVHRFSPY